LDARLIGPEAPAEKPGLSLPHGTSGTISPYGINSGSLALRLLGLRSRAPRPRPPWTRWWACDRRTVAAGVLSSPPKT